MILNLNHILFISKKIIPFKLRKISHNDKIHAHFYLTEPVQNE